MGDNELLQMPQIARSLQPPAPWHSNNLKVIEAGTDDGGPYVGFEGLDPTKNGHLEQVIELTETARKSTFTVDLSLWSRDPDRVGANIYLYFHPSDDADRQVFQLHHPGDGTWHRLNRDIPVPERRVYRIRLLIVARVGAGSFRMRTASLRYASEPDQSQETFLRENHISSAYHDAVMAMVDRHPSAADAAFRKKLSRYLLGSNRKGMKTVRDIATRLEPVGKTFSGCRFLDLGSGSGGSLVGALDAGAAYCEGWEINDEKLALSEINVTTRGVELDRMVVRNQTMETPDTLGADFQPFDIVFCEEVLEHVKDLDGAITTLSRCINREGGVGYVTMPNGFALKSVLADPHLELFGIALLDRFEAQPLATALKNHTHYSDMMGAYHRHEDYVERFAALGLALESIEAADASPKAIRSWRNDLDAIRERRKTLRGDWGKAVDGETLDLLEARLDTYLREAEVRWEDATTRQAPASVREAFARDYGQGHFAFLVTHGDCLAQARPV